MEEKAVTQKMVVFEINEVPLRIFRHFQKLRPGSNLDRLLQASTVIETLALDVEESFLYPSQTWASLNTGAPYDQHKIHWYNDPKPGEYPLYWKTIAGAGHTVGIVNTLHSSPAREYADKNDNYKFLIPDCFAVDSYTKPKYFEPFQSLNLKAVSSNSRTVSMKAPMQEAIATVVNAPRYGIRMKTMVTGAALMSKILMKRVNRERLRNMQFPLVADIFLRQFREHQPDLGILFTNHVAANMHRYWYGLFPDDYEADIYDAAWRTKYGMEILAAVDLLDNYLGQIMRAAEETGRILVLVSSMGQHANKKLTPEYRKSHSHDFRLADVKKLVSCLTAGNYSYRVDAAMVPQYSLDFHDADQAARCAAEMREAKATLEGIHLALDENANVLTLSVQLDPNAPYFGIRGKRYQSEELGFERFEIDDHHSGCHCPEGSLIIYNSKTSTKRSDQVNYLEYAPAILKHFGIERPAYMMEPSFQF